jgi:hypothetical protein
MYIMNWYTPWKFASDAEHPVEVEAEVDFAIDGQPASCSWCRMTRF